MDSAARCDTTDSEARRSGARRSRGPDDARLDSCPQPGTVRIVRRARQCAEREAIAGDADLLAVAEQLARRCARLAANVSEAEGKAGAEPAAAFSAGT